MNDHLLWIDLETTGSDVTKDCIIEIGAILTTTDLKVLDEYQTLVRPTAEGFGRLMLNAYVREMHEKNGLTAALLDPNAPDKPSPHEAAKDLLAWAEEQGAARGKMVLAGSGVGHFDRRFIDRYLGELSKALRYWCIDIGVIRRAHEMWVGPRPSDANDGKTHRALDDIRCHVEEARAFAELWSAPS